MDRRAFLLTSTAAAMALPQIGLAAVLEYTPGLVQERLDAGDTVVVRFTASWCSTCAAQERALNALRAENAAYGAITFVDVDWDAYGRSDLAQSLRIPRRSTLVVLKGNEELARIVAGTGKGQIQALLDTALAATA